MEKTLYFIPFKGVWSNSAPVNLASNQLGPKPNWTLHVFVCTLFSYSFSIFLQGMFFLTVHYNKEHFKRCTKYDVWNYTAKFGRFVVQLRCTGISRPLHNIIIIFFTSLLIKQNKKEEEEKKGGEGKIAHIFSCMCLQLLGPSWM